jgi:hypothetical protein
MLPVTTLIGRASENGLGLVEERRRPLVVLFIDAIAVLVEYEGPRRGGDFLVRHLALVGVAPLRMWLVVAGRSWSRLAEKSRPSGDGST